jgi:hypothetical protein
LENSSKARFALSSFSLEEPPSRFVQLKTYFIDFSSHKAELVQAVSRTSHSFAPRGVAQCPNGEAIRASAPRSSPVPDRRIAKVHRMRSAFVKAADIIAVELPHKSTA